MTRTTLTAADVRFKKIGEGSYLLLVDGEEVGGVNRQAIRGSMYIWKGTLSV